MATFRKRGPYQWQAQIRKKGYPPQSKTFESRASAEQWAREVEHEMDRGIFASRAEADSTTLGELSLAEFGATNLEGEIDPHHIHAFERRKAESTSTSRSCKKKSRRSRPKARPPSGISHSTNGPSK